LSCSVPAGHARAFVLAVSNRARCGHSGFPEADIPLARLQRLRYFPSNAGTFSLYPDVPAPHRISTIPARLVQRKTQRKESLAKCGLIHVLETYTSGHHAFCRGPPLPPFEPVLLHGGRISTRHLLGHRCLTKGLRHLTLVCNMRRAGLTRYAAASMLPGCCTPCSDTRIEGKARSRPANDPAMPYRFSLERSQPQPARTVECHENPKPRSIPPTPPRQRGTAMEPSWQLQADRRGSGAAPQASSPGTDGASV
jgi:hypothetical protein